MGSLVKYGEIHINLIKGMAEKGVIKDRIAEALDMPIGSLSTLAYKHKIKFMGNRGRPNPNPKIYGQADIDRIKKLADKGRSKEQIAESLSIPLGSVCSIIHRFQIKLSSRKPISSVSSPKQPIGRPKVDNPVRPYRPDQKQHYKKVGANNLSDSARKLATESWR